MERTKYNNNGEFVFISYFTNPFLACLYFFSLVKMERYTSIKSFELPLGARCIVGYLRQKSGHQLSKNSHIEILTSDLRLVLLLFFDFPYIRCPQKV